MSEKLASFVKGLSLVAFVFGTPFLITWALAAFLLGDAAWLSSATANGRFGYLLATMVVGLFWVNLIDGVM